MFHRPPRFAALVQILTTSAGLLSLVVFFSVFPLDFSQIGIAWVNSALKVVLIAGMAGAALALVVQAVQLAAGWQRFEYEVK
jgi:hypothetical protein